MEQDNSGVSTEIETPASGAELTPATESTATNGAEQGQQSETETPSAETPVVAFAPNMTYRANNEDKQMADWLKSAITDPDKEKYIKELFSKADGLDGVKGRFDSLKEEHQTFRKEYDEVVDTVKVLGAHVQNRDFDKFFEALNIPANLVQGWVLEKLQYKDMNPEQRAVYDARWNATRQATDLSRQNQQLKSQLELKEEAIRNQVAEQRLNEFNGLLQDSNVNSVMQEYDQRAGKIGAFREVVAQYAVGKFQMTGHDLSGKEAIEGVLTLMGKQTGVSNNSPIGQMPSAPMSKPVIPNIQGTQTSPIKKQPKSIDDLRAEYEKKYANQPST